MRILVGFEPNAGGSAALAHAAALALRERAQLTVLSAVAPPPFATFWAQAPLPEDPWRIADDVSSARVVAAARRLPAELTVRTLIRRGNHVTSLLAEHRREAYDMLVVGARRGLQRRLLRHSAIPVLVVPSGR